MFRLCCVVTTQWLTAMFLKDDVVDAVEPLFFQQICSKLRQCLSGFLQAIFLSFIKFCTVRNKPKTTRMGERAYGELFFMLEHGVSIFFERKAVM